MPFHLLVVEGRSESNSLRLADGVSTLGRQADCFICIKSSQVSRRHCELYEKKGILHIKDLGSANGTFVNGKKIRGEKALEPGDELAIGQVKLKVARLGEDAAARQVVPSAETAVVEAVSYTDEADEEFEIALDDGPLLDPEPVEAPAPAPAPAPKTTKAAAKSAPAEPAGADEAIADFLLDIKLDDEE
jgi:pSer/pThr/pTyr-binding forkhead associated (FHA) protein